MLRAKQKSTNTNTTTNSQCSLGKRHRQQGKKRGGTRLDRTLPNSTRASQTMPAIRPGDKGNGRKKHAGIKGTITATKRVTEGVTKGLKWQGGRLRYTAVQCFYIYTIWMFACVCVSVFVLM